jgi:hypothetical protein
VFIKNEENLKSYKSDKDSEFHFSPLDVSLLDDTYHGSTAPRFTEWWYFDVLCDTGYSIQISIRVLSLIKNLVAIISQRITLYKDGVLLQQKTKRFFLKKTDVSTKSPQITVHGDQIIKGKIDSSGKWIFDVSVHKNNVSADLHFEAETKDWKGKNPGGDWWAVIVPRASVNGILNIGSQKIKVTGIGYHDHNWDVRPGVQKNFGWFWGKINFPTSTAIWAVIFDKRNHGLPILMINENENGCINVPPKDIEFLGSNVRKKNGKYIPSHFNLKAKTEHMHLDVSMDISMSHHVRKMITLHYWRFHVLCSGFRSHKEKTENINDAQIAELLIFK